MKHNFIVWATVMCVGATSQTFAAGFYIQEQSVSAMGAAFAGQAANPTDATTIYTNPAGMTHLKGTQSNIGLHILVPKSDIDDNGSTLGGNPISGTDSDNPVPASPIPNLYFSHQVSDDFWLGLGISAPFGLGSAYSSAWFGRFDSIKSDLQTIDIQPSFAVRANDWLSIGGGINYQLLDVELTSAVTDGQEGRSRLEGDAATFGYTLGLLFEPWAHTNIGINYRSSVFHELQGRSSVTGTNASDFDIAVTGQLATPDIASFAIAHDVDDRLKILGQINWFGWNNFEAITVRNQTGGIISNIIQNYQTSWSYAIGGEYQANDKWTLRAGYQFDETPTTDEYRTSRTPDGDRHWLTAGGTYALDHKWSVDFAGAYIDIADETINVSRNSNQASVRAKTGGSVGIFSLGVNYKF